MIHKEEHESQIMYPADKCFTMFKLGILDLPNAMPGSYKSMQLLEGDGKSVGTVRLWNYVLGDDPKVLTAKDQLEEFDDENRRITSRILEGDLMVDYESFGIKLSVTSTSDGAGSLVKWVLEFEKKHDHSPHPHSHVDLLALVSSYFDALLHKPAATTE